MSLIGTTLRHRYEIFRYLGSGSFGNTYLANDLDFLAKPVCVVKQLNPKFSNPNVLKIAKDLFNREAEVLYKLKHPQIPQLFAHFIERDELYLVQEYADGYDLTKEIIPDQPKSEEEVLKLVREILEVLAFVHQQGIIHRDLKPQNIIRRKDGKIILIDFGAVKEISGLKVNAEGQTIFSIAIGTPGYMPSEQQNGHPKFSSDIYALGMIAFYALTGIPPLQLPRDPKDGELHCALLSETFGNTLQGNPIKISPDFAKILDQMVRCNYSQRYENASVALAALQKLDGTPDFTPIRQSVPQNFPSGDESSILQKIWKLLQKFFSDNAAEKSFPPTTAPQAPTKKSLEQPEGQVSLQSALYIERLPIEHDCYQEILQPGALIRIKAPRQMGKTSLLTRVIDHSTKHGFVGAYLNFQSGDAELFANLDKFLQWFCGKITRELNLRDKLSEYWHGVLGSKDKCTNYFQRYLLTEIHSPIVLGLDEVDQIFQYPQVAAEFFALLRSWHETSKNKDNWQKLRLLIVHSKEVYIPLNINQSPFNVGLPIDLPEFNESQVKDLVQRHDLNWTEEDIKQLIAMVGGHPYLVRKALYEISRDRISLSQLLQTAPTQEGMYRDHLHRHITNLQEDNNLVTVMRQVVTATNPVRIETGVAFKLRSMGLVKFQGNDVIPLCNLYKLYFRENLRGN